LNLPGLGECASARDGGPNRQERFDTDSETGTV